MKNFKEIVYGNLFEVKVKNPGPYIDGPRAKAGVETSTKEWRSRFPR